MKAIKSKILLVLVNALFDHAIEPLAREYVERTDNAWDDKALDFLVEVKKYCITKLQG